MPKRNEKVRELVSTCSTNAETSPTGSPNFTFKAQTIASVTDFDFWRMDAVQVSVKRANRKKPPDVPPTESRVQRPSSRKRSKRNNSGRPKNNNTNNAM